MNVTFMRRARVEEEIWELRVPAHTQLYGASMKPSKAMQMHVTHLYAGTPIPASTIAFRIRTKASNDMFHKAFLHSEMRLL